MELSRDFGDGNRLARALLAVVLTVIAVSSLRKGERLSGVVAGLGALAVGYGAATGSGELAETIDIGASGEDGGLRCAVCGQPIVPGQRRGPNESGEIVHETCEAPAE